MVFSSGTFLGFFALVFTLYWLPLKFRPAWQNYLLLAASYVFYGWTDWRFLTILIPISAFNYWLGIAVENAQEESTKRRWLMRLGMLQGIGGLLLFKYFNFFIESFNDLLHQFHVQSSIHTLSLIVPLGISFFTFRTISYILDIDKGKTSAVRNWVVFFDYIAFFPTILSGPIDKSGSFVPQLLQSRGFSYPKAVSGMRQILWGMFKKVVIADACAKLANPLFDHPEAYNSGTLLLGAFLFTIQLYTDFSGYSDMAIGFSRLLGLEISRNFELPFFAQNIAEYWRRWHISLTSWLTEYVFTPLSVAFRDWDRKGLALAVIINFTIIGTWHGPRWTYMLFGFLHGCYYIPLIWKGTMNKRKKIPTDTWFPGWQVLKNIVLTFLLVMCTNILFRAASLHDTWLYFKQLFSPSHLGLPEIRPYGLIAIIIGMFAAEWATRTKTHPLEFGSGKPALPLRYAIYLLLCFGILFQYGFHVATEFIYFKF